MSQDPREPGGTPPAQPQQPYPGYGQPRPYPGYGQPQQQQQWGATPGYPAASYPGTTYPAAYQGGPAAPARKSRMLGVIAFAVVAVATIAGAAAMVPIAQFMLPYMNGDPIDQTELTRILMANAPIPAIVLNLASPIGIAGWVTGIVAAALNRGRMWGVFAIILGLLAPIILVGVVIAVLVPYLA